jgi:hypothetical protein
MPLPDLFTPVIANELASFGGGSASKSAKINYDVALPGSYSWNRIVPLDIDPAVFVEAASAAGTSLLALGVVQGERGRLKAINSGLLADFYHRALPVTARPSLRHVAQVGGEVAPLLNDAAQSREPRSDHAAATVDGLGLLQRRAIVSEPDDVVIQRRRVDSYLGRLAATEATVAIPQLSPTLISLPTPGIGHSIHPVKIDPVAPPVPRIAIVETWELRSHLGDYGLGRTLQTFSLLPGEHTSINVQSWRTEAATREDSSSIFDSSDTAAQSRFTSSLVNESGSAFQDQGGWAASVSTSASGGINLGLVSGSASLSAGAAANHQESSQRFSDSVTQSASEHAAQVNNSRRQSVESASSTTTASGTAATTVREISNANSRRVLNFVFRELNQVHDTYVVLRDIQVAFYNGNPGSAEIVPLSDLGRLLAKYVDPAKAPEVARSILSLSAQRFDANSDLVTILESGTNPNGIKYDWKPAELDAKGALRFQGDVLATDVRWRFSQGALSKDKEGGRKINGAIMSRSSVVLRTDNLIVEALLGQADAVDPYASALQALDLRAKNAQTNAQEADTRQDTAALDLVTAQSAPDRIEAWRKVFPHEPEIQVVPATVFEGNGHLVGTKTQP